MNYIFRPEAEDELDNQMGYYESERPGLDREFLNEIIRGIGKIIDQPEAWPMAYYKDCRKYPTDRFLFKIVYKYYESRSQILIVAIAHGKRKPGYWKARF
jgi:toxin ParE1/3/4